jgi:hypothetical protein
MFERQVTPSKITPETLFKLDSLRGAFDGPGYEIEWFLPEVVSLEGKRIIIVPSGVYWAEVVEPVHHTVAGYIKTAIHNIDERLDEGYFVYGGEELAQDVLHQCHLDLSY